MSDGIDREIINLNLWPSSQLCMECKHGSFVMDDVEPSAYMCKVGINLGPCESSCDSKEAPKEERFLANDPIEW